MPSRCQRYLPLQLDLTLQSHGPGLKPEYIHGLVEAAIRIHQGQLQRKQILRATWAVVLFGLLPSLGSIAAALITRAR